MRVHGVRRGVTNEEPPRHSRWRRWARRSLVGVVGFCASVVIAVPVVAHNLDRPWLKRRVQALAHSAAGFDVDYRAARIGLLSGARIDGLVVRSPVEVRAFGPDLVRIGRLEARWSLGSLLGIGPRIERVTLSDVAVTTVVDEHGRTSFDALSHPGSTSAPRAPVPLSRQAATWLRTAPPIGRIDLGGVTFAFVRTDAGHASERSELSGIALAMSTEAAATGWRVKAGLGTPGVPLDLRLAREREGSPATAGRARLSFTLDATSSAMTALLDLRVLEQTIAPSLPAEEGVHLEVKVGFDAALGRTTILLEHAVAGERVATADASIEVPDTGDPIVRHARGDADLAQLLNWAPAGLVPVTAERARIRYRIDSLVVGPKPRVAAGGAVAVDADLSDVRMNLANLALRIGSGKLSLFGQPAANGGVAASGSIDLTGTRLTSGSDRFAADDLAVDFDGGQGADGAIAGRIGVRSARIERGGSSPIVAADARVELRVQDVRPDIREPLSARGEFTPSIELGSLDVSAPGTRAIVDGLRLHAHTVLDGHAPYGLELEGLASRIRVLGRDGNLFVDAPARVEGRVKDVQPELAHPATSSGAVHAMVGLGEIRTSLDATKGSDAIDFAFRTEAASLKAVRPFLPPALAKEAPWDSMAATVRSSGHIERLATSPRVRQTTEIDLERPAFDNVTAESVSLTIRSEGTALQHRANVDLRALRLALDGDQPSDEHVALSADMDRTRPSLEFELATDGRATAKLSGSLAFDPLRRALAYAVEGNLAGLGALAPFTEKVHGLEAFDLSELEVGLSTRGTLLGVVRGILPDGTIRLEATPARTAVVEGKTDLRVAHFRWSNGQAAIRTPALTWHGDMRFDGGRRILDSRVEIGTLHIDLGSQGADLNGISDEATAAVVGNLMNPDVELTQRLSVRAIEQAVLPEYPLGDVTLELSAERGPEGVVHVSDLRVANGLGGTALASSGNIELSETRRTLSVTTSLTQDLARLSSIPERFRGRGKVAVEANVTSPDLAHYVVRAAVKGEDVTVTLPGAGVDVETANGDVPITVAFEVGDDGVVLHRSEARSPYSMLRFADQHPLLNRSGFLSIARLSAPFVSIAPLVGNLEVEQNFFSLRQFEMGVRGGTITGQCGVDWDGPKSTAELHVRANGVQSSHGEPFDGNIAVTISGADRTIDGRAEILRIGKRHLLDLLDLEDPLHVDRAMNRIRGALGFGYPKSLRLVFDHGFASAHLELGGLASLVSIGELRGIPMGPIVDKTLAPVLAGPGRKETP